jgi:hypothetical protein
MPNKAVDPRERAPGRARARATYKSIDPQAHANVFAAEDRAREAAINERLDQLGAPADARGRAGWFERQAERARLEAGRQDVARLAEMVVQNQHDAIAEDIEKMRRERERIAQCREDLARMDRAMADIDRREQAREDARQIAETRKQVAERVKSLRSRLAWTPWSVTKAERTWFEQYGAH